MKFQSMSLVAGTKVCNAKCPFCVSRMTGMEMIEKKAEPIHERNLGKAIQLAEKGGVTNVIITGKGEPTLYPEHLDQYMRALDNRFPFVELQTNGWVLSQDSYKGCKTETALKSWYERGMTTIMISNCGYDAELNRQIYFPRQKEYIDLKRVVDLVHEAGMMVRYTTVGIQGTADSREGISSERKFDKLVNFCQELGIEQLTWRPVIKTTSDENDGEGNIWVNEYGLTFYMIEEIEKQVKRRGTELYRLAHGAVVYDYRGQNVCISSCLTRDADDELIRQLIFFPNGQLYTDWEYKGSRLL